MRKLALLLMLLALPAFAERVPPRMPTVGSSSNLAQRLQSAQSLMRTRPDLALDLLQQLNREYPGQDHLLFEMSRAQILLEQYDEAEALLRELLERSPLSLGIGTELAKLLLRTGREEEGRRMAEEMYLAGSYRASSFAALADLYRSVDRYDLAESAYRLGLARLSPRDERGRSRLFEGLLQEYSIGGRPDAILRAFADWPHDYKSHAPTRNLVRSAERLLREHEDLPELGALADSLGAAPSGERLAPLLREVHFAGGDWEAYLHEVQRAYPGEDSARRAWLKNEARRCEEHPRVARRIWEKLLAEGESSPEGRQAQLALLHLDLEADAVARLRGEAGNPGLTLELAELCDQNWGADQNLQICLARQDFLRGRQVDAAAAEEAIREALLKPYAWFPRHETWRLEIELGLDLLALEREDEARGHFEALAAATGSEDAMGPAAPMDMSRLRQRSEAHLSARYQLARTDILTGNLQAAQDSLAELAKEYPSAREANDALEDALLLAESSQWPQSLADLMRGSLELEIRQRPLEAAERLALFAEEFPEDESIPTLLFRMGVLYERAYRATEAVEAWTRLERDFTDHHRAATALERAARLSLRLGEVERARGFIEGLLERHPESTQLPGLRELREQVSEDA